MKKKAANVLKKALNPHKRISTIPPRPYARQFNTFFRAKFGSSATPYVNPAPTHPPSTALAPTATIDATAGGTQKPKQTTKGHRWSASGAARLAEAEELLRRSSYKNAIGGPGAAAPIARGRGGGRGGGRGNLGRARGGRRSSNGPAAAVAVNAASGGSGATMLSNGRGGGVPRPTTRQPNKNNNSNNNAGNLVAAIKHSNSDSAILRRRSPSPITMTHHYDSSAAPSSLRRRSPSPIVFYSEDGAADSSGCSGSGNGGGNAAAALETGRSSSASLYTLGGPSPLRGRTDGTAAGVAAAGASADPGVIGGVGGQSTLGVAAAFVPLVTATSVRAQSLDPAQAGEGGCSGGGHEGSVGVGSDGGTGLRVRPTVPPLDLRGSASPEPTMSKTFV